MLDLGLAVARHLLIFALFAALVGELVYLRADMSREMSKRLATTDLWYGILAGLVVIVGFSRAIFAAKGWYYYSHNLFFWVKIGDFGLIALLSIPPTIALRRWSTTPELPGSVLVHKVRRFVVLEFVLFFLLPVFAAAMARGLGEYR
jgi:putative membrane protein